MQPNYLKNQPFHITQFSITSPPINTMNPSFVENNHWRLDELNERLISRIYPDFMIPSLISSRPSETRQTILGNSTDPRVDMKVRDIIHYPIQNSSIRDNFISTKGDPIWFLHNIDTETKLKNQCFALQTDCPQATYIPDSSSELYKIQLPPNSHPVQQPFPYLFHKQQFQENQRTPITPIADTRNNYIMNTPNTNLYRNKKGIQRVRPDQRVFYNIDRAKLSHVFQR